MIGKTAFYCKYSTWGNW